MPPAKDLDELIIYYYKGSRYPSWMFGRPQKLALHDCSRLVSIPEDSELFTHLRELHFMYCDWDRLPENMERLVSLQKLFIFDCDKMELLPTLPQSLLKINIVWCGVLGTTCKEEGHENWHKIHHIPDKVIFP